MAVVTKNVPPYTIVVGNPARVVKYRYENPDVISFLQEIKWWDWSDEKIKRNKEFFFKNLALVQNVENELRPLIVD
jgi:virginiamycin A acetyltransferase